VDSTSGMSESLCPLPDVPSESRASRSVSGVVLFSEVIIAVVVMAGGGGVSLSGGDGMGDSSFSLLLLW